MFKSAIRYMGIGVAFGIGLTLIQEIHYNIVWESRLKDVESLTEEVKNMKAEMYVDSSELFTPDRADKYDDPENDLFFNLQGYKDLGDKVEFSGLIVNRGSSTWEALFLNLEAYDESGNIIADCNHTSGRILPGDFDGVIVLCEKRGKYMEQKISSVNVQIKFNFHGQKVLT